MTWTKQSTEALMRTFKVADEAVDAKERKKRKIVAAAAKQFLRFGYRKTSVDDVARDAGVAKGTVYLYFSTKPELLLHAVVAEKAPLIDVFLNVMEEPAPRKRLWRYVYETARALPLLPLSRQFAVPGNDFEPALDELGPDLATALTEQRTESLTHLLKPFLNATDSTQQDIEDRTMAFLGLIYTMPAALEKSVASGLDPDRAAKIYADMLVDGFAAEAATAETSGRRPAQAPLDRRRH